MDKDVAGGVRISGHITGTHLADGFAFFGNSWHVAEVGNLPWGANREDLLIGSQPHG